MNKYNCPWCGYFTKSKNSFIYHLKCKNLYSSTLKDISIKQIFNLYKLNEKETCIILI